MVATPIVPLLKTVFESILEVFLLCLAGYILARRGVVDRKTQKQLNRLNVSLFTPSLLFSKVAFFLSPAKLRELWIIPIFFVITTCVSMTVAYVISRLLRLKKSQRNFAMAASMFMNSNSLPIALMQSLVLTVPGLKWGDDDNKDAMVGRALTYLVLYSTFGMVLRWSYGVRLLSQADPEGQALIDAEPASPLLTSGETAFPPSQEEQRVLRHETSNLSADTDATKAGDATKHAHLVRHPSKAFYSFPNSPSSSVRQTPAISAPSTPPEYVDGEDADDEDELLPRRQVTEPTSSHWQSRVRRTRHKVGRAWATFSEFMTVPLWAALASLVVACIQPLQHALDAHLQPIKGAISAAGNCSIPITLVVLGAYFYTPTGPEEAKENRSRGMLPSFMTRSRSPSRASRASLFENVRDMFSMSRRTGPSGAAASQSPKRPGETKTVFVAVFSRMIITPMLLLPMMALMTKYNVQEVFDDPVFVVANVLLIASPAAVTLAQITQAASGDSFERLISRTIFWSYCVVTPPSTIIVVVIGLLLSTY